MMFLNLRIRLEVSILLLIADSYQFPTEITNQENSYIKHAVEDPHAPNIPHLNHWINNSDGVRVLDAINRSKNENLSRITSSTDTVTMALGSEINNGPPDNSTPNSDSSHNLELMAIVKERFKFYFIAKQSWTSTILIIAMAAFSITLYSVLVLCRRRLQNAYGNRELLLQNGMPSDY